MTYTYDQLKELEERVRGMTIEQRDELAERFINVGAPGQIFEAMHKGGWRPLSQREGDGIVGGALEPAQPRLRRRKS